MRKSEIETKKMMDAKQAVKIARNYFDEVFADQPVDNVLLEELERTEDGKWRVTLGFDRGGSGDLRTLVGRAPRYYKIITIDAAGTPESLKIRAV